MRMKKNICAILACAMIFGAFSIPVAEAKEAPVMQIMEMRATGEFSFDIPAKTLMKASSGFPMEYGETVKINRAIKWQTSLSGLSPNTNYVVELWVRHVGSTTNNKKGSVSVRTNSNGKASVSQQVTFSSPGEIETTIKVYKGSTLVAERTGGSPDMVYARWSINLALNSNHLGTLYFYYASGAQAHHCDAKGKSGKGYTWDKEYGHTPPGDYYGETGGPSKDTEKYGPNKFIRMKGNQDPGYENLYVDGDYVTRGRSGLLIHGGRDQTSLWNTEGCVRIFDKDAKKITGLMDSWRSAGYHQFGRIKITRPGQSL